MSEYWKSNPRKFCDYCKCWIADNKPSIEFHERGKRHKECVQKRLDEIGKKGKEDYENKLKEKDYMEEMEQAALKAYKKDIEHNPDFTGAKIAEIAKASNVKIVVGSQAQAKKEEKVPTPAIPRPHIKRKWQEAKTPEGFSYYWNTETGESVWEAPKEGFTRLEERKDKKPTISAKLNTSSSSSNKEPVSTPALKYGPMPKNDPYGSWENVHQSAEEVNLQLPSLPEEEYYVPEVVRKKPEMSFKEKVVTISARDSGCIAKGPVAFKKRKGGDDQKKNVRRRIDD